MKGFAGIACCVALALGACAQKGGSGRGADATAARPAAADAAAAPVVVGDPQELVVDPYCGMKIKKGEAAATAVYQGVTYYFCLADHRDAFLADPHKALCRLAGDDAGADCDAR